MQKLFKEYIGLLSSDRLPSDRFWELEKRIRDDKRATGVVVTNSRSNMIGNILALLHEGAITLDDLSDFSEELQERIKSIYSKGKFRDPDAKDGEIILHKDNIKNLDLCNIFQIKILDLCRFRLDFFLICVVLNLSPFSRQKKHSADKLH